MIEADRKALVGAIREISNSMIQIESHKEYIKESIDTLSEKHDIPKKVLRTIINLYHKDAATDMFAETTQIQELYDSIFKTDSSES